MGTEASINSSAPISTVGNVAFIFLTMATVGTLAVCLSQRLRAVKSWKNLAVGRWLILAIYTDSLLFVFLTAIFFKGVGIDDYTMRMCDAAAILCLTCYISTKVLLYYFLVEKAYIVRAPTKPRMKDKLYLLNFFGVMGPYIVCLALNFKFRFAFIDESGHCFLGIQRPVLAAVIGFEILLNIYMTLLFVVPLREYYAYKRNPNSALRTAALRAFIGSSLTLASNAANLSVLMALNGEKGWICLLTCNADILFTVLVLHWMTSIDKDNHSPSGANGSGSNSGGRVRRNRRRNSVSISIGGDISLSPGAHKSGNNENNHNWASGDDPAEGTLVVTKSGRVQMIPKTRQEAEVNAHEEDDINQGTWFQPNASSKECSDQEDWSDRIIEPWNNMAV